MNRNLSEIIKDLKQRLAENESGIYARAYKLRTSTLDHYHLNVIGNSYKLYHNSTLLKNWVE